MDFVKFGLNTIALQNNRGNVDIKSWRAFRNDSSTTVIRRPSYDDHRPIE